MQYFSLSIQGKTIVFDKVFGKVMEEPGRGRLGHSWLEEPTAERGLRMAHGL